MPMPMPMPAPFPTPSLPPSTVSAPSIATSTAVPFEPTWLDMANFTVSLIGTIASTLIALTAVGLTIATVVAGRRREDRAKREAWVRDYMLWLDDGAVFLAAGFDAALLTNRAWISRGQELDNRARVFDTKSGTIDSILKPARVGARAYMRAQRTASDYIEKMPVDDRMSAALTGTRMLKLWVEGWVNDPKLGPGDITEWLTTVAKKPTAETLASEPTEPKEPTANETVETDGSAQSAAAEPTEP